MKMKYSLTGRFYRVTESEGSLLTSTTSEALIAKVECDVQEDASGSRLVGDTLIFLYVVYCDPIPNETILEGDIFRCDMYGKAIEGRVKFSWQHSMGCEIKIQSNSKKKNG